MDDKYQNYSKKIHKYSHHNDENNENSQNKPFTRDSLTISEQKVARLNKIFNLAASSFSDELADFTTPSDLDDYNMGSSSQTRYRDKKYNNNEYMTNPYRKHYQPVDASYNKYLNSSIVDKRPSQPEVNEISYDKTSAEQISPKSYAAYQRRYERMKQQNDYHSRSKYSAGQKYGQSSGNILFLLFYNIFN